MFCRKCGIKFDDTYSYCPQCSEKVSEEETTQQTSVRKESTCHIPFRDQFYHHIKGFSFLAVVIITSVYFSVNIINSIFHFSTSDIFTSSVSVLYGLVSFGLIVPALWMIYMDKSPHSAFTPIKFMAFINCLKMFIAVALGVLTVAGAMTGKEEIPNSVLYLAHETTSVYLVALLSDAAKNPSFMLLSTASIMWITYVLTVFMYNISLSSFLGSLSKRINDNTTNPSGYKTLGAISFFVAIINILYAMALALLMKDDIYNILTTAFGGLFHLAVFINLRGFGKIYDNSYSEEIEEQTDNT